MAVSAPVLDASGKPSRDMSLEEAIFGAEPKPHLVHEAVRAELNARRAGTRGAKSRGLVSGGRTKPWRQKGTGRARAGTTRAPQWTGGGVAFPPSPRDFSVKVNRKERRAAFRTALSAHASTGTLAVFDGASFAEPSTRAGAALLEAWGKERPVVVVVTEDEVSAAKSFRNLARDAVRARDRRGRLGPVAARQRDGAPARAGEGGVSLHPNEILIAPVVSEKSYSLINDNKYTFKVHKDAHKTQIRQAVEELFEVSVLAVNVSKIPSKPKRRGMIKGRRPGWKKAVVELREGDSIPIFQGAQV
jgi:large subunit ribosomal protein L4